MKKIFEMNARKLSGTNYEKPKRTLFISLIVFWGLYIAGLDIQIAPSVFYLMISTYTAGVMWQALSSEDNAANLQNLFMLPFHDREFVFSYVAALGFYTLFTKTSLLLAVLFAVSDHSPAQIPGSIFCTVNAVLMAAVVYSLRKYRAAGILWTAGILASVLFWGNRPWYAVLFPANIVPAVLLLRKTDGYAFCLPARERRRKEKESGRFSIPRYFFRYMRYHKNYMVNTLAMWCAACVLPLFFRQMKDLSFVPMGFALLSLNTPVCILLSADPALEQAVRFLPGQKRAFCVPYCFFIFVCNMSTNVIFLCSLFFHGRGITVQMAAAAVFFALQSAVCSVLLEWFCPVRNWKIESDLWHHPRKYLVPTAMLLLAGAAGALPLLIPGFTVFLAVEIMVLLF